jgi:thymidylate synthase (FAD)
MPDNVVYFAARTCYNGKDLDELWNDSIRDGFDLCHAPLLNRLKKLGHMSPFEHASFTFSVDDVSRVTTHQLVRHRMASYSQKSQRYRDAGDFCIVPDSVRDGSDEAFKAFSYALSISMQAYDIMIACGVPIEDARYILPGGMASSIVVTMNARELMHFYDLRTGKGAQWEIKELAEEMMSLAKMAAPGLFGSGDASGSDSDESESES